MTKQHQKQSKVVKSSNAPPVAGRSKATTHSQKQAMVNWLEEPRNFNLITGNGAANYSGIIAGAKLKKRDAYDSLAAYVNQTCCTNWTVKQAEARYKAYVKCYKKVARAVANPGGKKFCISLDDHARGIVSLEQKKDHLCTFYGRMDNLFGGRQNIVPSHMMKTTAPGGFGGADSDSEDEEEDDDDSVDDESVGSASQQEEDDFEEEYQADQQSKCLFA